ncbi:MAG: YjfB family protein [Selenomonadaceae bacterium]|nr:YjfB family protein [Selenomonadaceae bacterium]MBR6710075.1 YjfB family protein [Selenomonadaceae bacterium]
MDLDMSIAAMSVSMHQMQASQDMGVAVLKMAMETAETGTEDLLAELAVDPNLGTMVDIQA